MVDPRAQQASVTLNLRTERGTGVATQLVATADVVLENFRPGTMEHWGLGPEDVHAINPRAIYARVTGYGQTGLQGPSRFAAAGEAIAGLRYINGYPDQAPPRYGISLGDTLAAQSAFQGIMLALYARDARGAEGQVVDASDRRRLLRDAGVDRRRVREDGRHPGAHRTRGCRGSRRRTSTRWKDGKWVVIAANHDTLWKRLAVVMGHPDFADDPRFATHHARGENEDLLDEIIGAFAAQHTAAELDEIVNEAGVVCAPVYTAQDIYDDPWFRERGLLVAHEDEVHGEMSMTGVVPKLTGTPGRIPPRRTLDRRRRHGGRARRDRDRGRRDRDAARGRDVSRVAQLGGGLLGRDDVEVHAGAELEAGEVRQARHDVDPPAEVLGVARRGAHPQVQRRAGAEPAREAPQPVVQQRGAGRAVVLEARPRRGAGRA